MKRHRRQEWLKFLRRIDAEAPPHLDIHLIADNYATHKHAKVKAWLKRHPRFHMHFTPTSGSWLNQAPPISLLPRLICIPGNYSSECFGESGHGYLASAWGSPPQRDPSTMCHRDGPFGRTDISRLDASPGALQYGLSVLSVAISLGMSLAFEYYGFRSGQWGLFGAAIAFATWYGRTGPSALAVALSVVCFDYFFTEPRYAFSISPGDLPYFVFFVAWTLVVASFSALLRRTTDRLQLEVTRRKHREEEVRKLNQELARHAAELEASNRELESFAYSVSHDLRAPLRHVVGYSELLQKQASASLDDKSRRYLQTILESAKRMGNLIDDLLAFSRIGRAETKQTAVDLEQLVKEVVAEIGEEARGRDITWTIDALPVCYGDRSMLRLVVVNLVSNAVKFTRMRGRAEIEIGCVIENENEVEVFVRDNGAGFDMRYVDKLFGVFQRLHLPEQFEGTGIGLATVQRIIHRQGGKVRAEGTVDQGATFYFSLIKVDYSAEKRASNR
jgi:signal transduction histidine kinase